MTIRTAAADAAALIRRASQTIPPHTTGIAVDFHLLAAESALADLGHDRPITLSGSDAGPLHDVERAEQLLRDLPDTERHRLEVGVALHHLVRARRQLSGTPATRP